MALELRQQLKLAQQLVMTPQLQQAIKLLQLSRVELLETVQQEMLDNPFLEELSGDESSSDQAAQTERREAVEEEVYDKELAKDASWEDYLGEFASTPRQVQPRDFEAAEEISPLEARYAAKPTLEGHLLWQLRLSMLTEAQKEIGEVIIGNLASSGYLQATLEEIAEMTTSTPDEVRALLSRLFGYEIDPSVRVFPPFYTDFGRNIAVGKGVFINACCHFQDHGGVTLGDGCQIGHNVVFATLDHGIAPAERRTTVPAPIVLGRNVWVGSNATILRGVTIGDNAVVAAGAVVAKDVEANTIVGGVPARLLRRIDG